jgi:hypothetical protein
MCIFLIYDLLLLILKAYFIRPIFTRRPKLLELEPTVDGEVLDILELEPEMGNGAWGYSSLEQPCYCCLLH